MNRLVRACLVREVDELLARRAAALRTATGREHRISAADAIVAAFAKQSPDPVVMSSDPDDLAALTAHARSPVTLIRG